MICLYITQSLQVSLHHKLFTISQVSIFLVPKAITQHTQVFFFLFENKLKTSSIRALTYMYVKCYALIHLYTNNKHTHVVEPNKTKDINGLKRRRGTSTFIKICYKTLRDVMYRNTARLRDLALFNKYVPLYLI